MDDAMLRLVETISKFPGIRKARVTLESLQNILLETNGFVMTKGHSWNIVHDIACPGIYEVWLVKKEENDG